MWLYGYGFLFQKIYKKQLKLIFKEIQESWETRQVATEEVRRVQRALAV